MTNATKGMTEYQHEIAKWCITVFGEEIARNVPLRCYRFFEEATELVQSLGMTEAQCSTVMKYVYGRPVGEPHQEVGGTAVTFAALCAAQGLSMHNCAWAEHERCMRPEVMEKIRNKQKNKPNPLDVLPASDAYTDNHHCRACGALRPQHHFGCSRMATAQTSAPTTMQAAYPAAVTALVAQGMEQLYAEEAKVPFHLSADREAAVSDEHYYLPMDVCPRGVKVLLLTLGGVATLGVYDGHDTQWRGWFPLPKECK